MDLRKFGQQWKQGSKFLRTHELRDGGPRLLTIASVEIVDDKFNPGKSVVRVVCTDGTCCDLHAEDTRNRLIRDLGPDTDGWIGQQIEAYYDPMVRSPKGVPGGTRFRLPEAPPDVENFVSDLDEETPRYAKPNGSGQTPPARRVARSTGKSAAKSGDDVPF